MNKPKKFLIIGRTASGKTEISKEVSNRLKLKVVKSYTTRKKRNIDDDDHIFINPEEVERYRDSMIAYTEINGCVYFVTYEMLDNSDIYVIDPQGAEYLRQSCNDFEFIEIYIRAPGVLSETYAKKRGDNISKYKQRHEAEDKQFTEYENKYGFHYHLLNVGTLSESVEKVCGWIQKELGRESD